jgi:serpin B
LFLCGLARDFEHWSAGGSAAASGQQQFAVELYQQLAHKSNGNLCLSPSSIQMALAMTFAGARGKTAQQMAEVLHFELPADQLHSEFSKLCAHLTSSNQRDGLELRAANRLWGQSGYEFLPSFLDLTKKYYGAELGQVDFIRQPNAAQRTINGWIAQQTNNRIPSLLSPGAISSDTRLVLTNAQYFLGEWVHPFEKRSVTVAPFHLTAERQVQAPFMMQSERLRYADEREIQILELPYRGTAYSLLVLLPKETDGLKAMEETLSPNRIEELAIKLKSRPVVVYLPSFKSNSNFDLGSTLSAMGMPSAFSSSADFSGIATTEDLFLSAVVHEAYIDVNIKGTEAAAATAVVTDAAPAPPKVEPVTFRADHPFMYIIRDRRDGTMLFVGRLADPTK